MNSKHVLLFSYGSVVLQIKSPFFMLDPPRKKILSHFQESTKENELQQKNNNIANDNTPHHHYCPKV